MAASALDQLIVTLRENGFAPDRIGEHGLKVRGPRGVFEIYHEWYGQFIGDRLSVDGATKVSLAEAAQEAGIRTQFMYRTETLAAVIEQVVATVRF